MAKSRYDALIEFSKKLFKLFQLFKLFGVIR